MKKLLLKSMFILLGLVVGVNTMAETYTLSPSQTTNLNKNDADNILYNESATSWLCNMSAYSGGAFKSNSTNGIVLITKFDASSILEGKIVSAATLTFNAECTTAGKNAQILTASINTGWDATTATWNNTNNSTSLSAVVLTNQPWTVKNQVTEVKHDVTDLLKNSTDGTLGFAICTGTAREHKITDIVLSIEVIDASTTVDYSVKFVDAEGNEIKTTDVRRGVPSTSITLMPADLESFFNSDNTKKYIYVSDDSADKTIAADGTTVVTVTFREAAKYSYTAKSNAGTYSVTGEAWEGDKATVAFPKYQLVDGVLYTKAANESSRDYFHQSFDVLSDGHVEIFIYTSNAENVVYYKEVEDIEGVTAVSGSNANIRCSNALGGYNSGTDEINVTTLSAGVYKLYTMVWGNAGTNLLININGEEMSCATKGYLQAYDKEFTLYAEGNITLPKSGTDGKVLDYIYIQKTGDAPTAITAAVGESGLATFCSPASLDFSTATSIAAYKASIDNVNNVVNLTKVTTVAAGEGVLLRSLAGGAATEDLKVIASVAAAEDNAFVGTLTDIQVYEIDGANTNYVLSNGSAGVGFYKAKAEADGGTKVGAGKAYLPVPTTSAAKLFSLNWGDDEGTTGINDVNAAVKTDAAYYTLQGVKVAVPTKGLYIVNGKKVVIK